MDVHYQASSAAPTWKIWARFPERWDHFNPRQAFVWHEDFAVFPAGETNTTRAIKDLQVFQSDGAAITDSGVANVSAINLASDGDNEGIIAVSSVAPIRITRDSTREVAFGIRFRASTIADSKNGFFAGLWEAATPTATSHIAANGTLADLNFIGFHRLESDGDALDVVYKADGEDQVSFGDALTLEAETWHKAELWFDGKKTVRFYLDGLAYNTAELGRTALDEDTFPSDTNLGVAFGLLNGTGSTPGSVDVDWARFAYTFGDSD